MLHGGELWFVVGLGFLVLAHIVLTTAGEVWPALASERRRLWIHRGFRAALALLVVAFLVWALGGF